MIAPKLRFKADDGSAFPDWEEKKINDIATCFAGATPSTKIPEYWEDGTIQWMSSGEVNNGQIFETEKRISKLGFDKCSTKMVKPNTVVIALAGQGKTRGMVAITRTSLCTNQSLCAIETNTDICDDYLYQYLQLQYNNLRLISSGDGTRGGLNLKLIGNYSVSIPSLSEQQKIADFLSTIDTIIEKQRATVSAWEERKKGVMQKLFSQEVRFKADDGSDFPDWEEKRLGDICKTFSGGTPKSGEVRYYENGTISFIRSGEIHDEKTELFITEEGLNESSARMVYIGDILYALYGATSGEVDISKINGAINQAILCIRPVNNYEKKFLVEILRYKKEYILRTYLQGGQGNLSAKIIQNLHFDFPCADEQQKIADCLSGVV